MPKKDQQRIEELTRDLQRVQAEFVNFKRRSGEERGELLNMAKQEVVRDLLPVLDNLDRALGHFPAELKDHPWAKGVAQIGKQVDDALQQLGVTKIKALGAEFDPHLHEAISFEDGAGEHEIITEELQPGYQLGDKVLRHAVVRVGKQSNQKKEK